MPTYDVFTRTVIEKVYKLELSLPIDMGESTERLTDRMVREGMANETISLSDLTDGREDGFEEETITCIMREGKTIVPRHRKKADKVEYDTPETVEAKAKKASAVIDMFAPSEDA